MRATLLLVLTALAAPARAEPPAQLAGLRFLLGSWEAASDGSGASGAFTFAPGVQDQVIVRTNYSNSPAADGRPASRHDDLMIIYVEEGQVRAEYFDNEGHVIRYVAEVRPGEVLFTSEVRANEPRYRLAYRLLAGGALEGRFDVAPPGRPDGFAQYLTWTAKRR